MEIFEKTDIAPDEAPEPLGEISPVLEQKRRSQGRIILDRFLRHRTATVGAIFLIVLFFFCFLGPFVTGHNHPDDVGVVQPFAPASLQLPFGADDVGRDLFARAMAGGQISLLVGLSSMLVAIVLGISIGACAGYYGGIVDSVLMRITDTILSIPMYLLLFVLSASFTNGSLWLDDRCPLDSQRISGTERARICAGGENDWCTQSPLALPSHLAQCGRTYYR
jgi:peptide/nickel transport system permease protein